MTSDSGTALKLRGIVKRFGSSSRLAQLLGSAPERSVLNGVDLDIAQGERLALRGLNGSGKSTLLRIAAGLLLPNHGEVMVLGAAPAATSRAMVGYASGDERSFFLRLSGLSNLSFYGAMYGLSPARCESRAKELAASLELDSVLGLPVSSMSSGTRARLGLVRALLHHPKLLLLDEPEKSQDPVGRGLTEALLKELTADGVAVLIATHDAAFSHPSDRSLVLQDGLLRTAP